MEPYIQLNPLAFGRIGNEPCADIEQNFDLLEKELRDIKGKLSIICLPNRFRQLNMSCAECPAVHTVRDENFEKAFLNMFTDLRGGNLGDLPKDWDKGATTSQIDGWVSGGGLVKVTPAPDGSCFGITTARGKDERNLVEVDSKRLIYAFEEFNKQCGRLNGLYDNPLFEKLLGKDFKHNTVCYEV